MADNDDRSGARELNEDLLDLVVGGAGVPPPAAMAMLVRTGTMRPMPAARPSPSRPGLSRSVGP